MYSPRLALLLPAPPPFHHLSHQDHHRDHRHHHHPKNNNRKTVKLAHPRQDVKKLKSKYECNDLIFVFTRITSSSLTINLHKPWFSSWRGRLQIEICTSEGLIYLALQRIGGQFSGQWQSCLNRWKRENVLNKTKHKCHKLLQITI